MLDSCVAKQPRTAANRRRTRASCERLGHRCSAAGLVKFWGNPGDIHGSSRRAGNPENRQRDRRSGRATLHARAQVAEVATFPSPSPVAPKPQAPVLAEAAKPQRMVVTPDGLVSALQGRLQQAV